MSKAVVSPGAGRSPKRLRKKFKKFSKAMKEDDRNENHRARDSSGIYPRKLDLTAPLYLTVTL